MARTNGPVLADFDYADHGSIHTLIALSPAALAWREEHLPEESFHGDAVYIETRYVEDILIGALDDGLTIVTGDWWIVLDEDGDLTGAHTLPS